MFHIIIVFHFSVGKWTFLLFLKYKNILDLNILIICYSKWNNKNISSIWQGYYFIRKDVYIMLIPYLLFLVGLLFIIKGGDLFVEGASWLARVTGLPDVLIGATVVSIATTLPETTVSAISALQNQTSMAMGNAIGSIICNTGLIVGVSNIIKPSKLDSKIFYEKGIMLLIYIAILWVLAFRGVIATSSSFILLAMLVLYILFNVRTARLEMKQSTKRTQKSSFTKKEAFSQALSFILGAILILVGADLLVDYGVIIAEHWHVPSAIISLTLISLGTSLPELITAISSLRKGHAGLSLGNILGANILNLAMVLGVSSLLNPLEVHTQNLSLDIPVAFILNALLIIPVFFTKKISRSHGALIFSGYVLYVAFLFFLH